MTKLKKVKEWIIALGICIALVWLFISFIGSLHIVRTSGMQQSIYAGDLVWINKTKYGAKLPSFGTSFYGRTNSIPAEIKNELVAFYLPAHDSTNTNKQLHFSRVVGLPGDSVQLSKSTLLVNNVVVPTGKNVLFNHYLSIKADLTESFFHSIKLEGKIPGDKNGQWIVPLNPKQALDLHKHKAVDALKTFWSLEEDKMENVFPNHKAYPFNIDFWGPVRTPKKGDTLLPNQKDIELLRFLLENHEPNPVKIEKNYFLSKGDTLKSYILQYNYYTVISDNRHHCLDSRHFGFLPETHIIGKPTHSLLSIARSPFKIRWKRWFNKL